MPRYFKRMQTARRSSPPGGDSPAVYWKKIASLHHEACFKMEQKLLKMKKQQKESQELVVELMSEIEHLQKHQKKTIFFALH